MNIIDLEQIIYISSNIGIDMLSDTEIELLKQTPFEEMYRWGMLSMSLGDKKSKKDFKFFVPVEKGEVNSSKTELDTNKIIFDKI